MLFKMTPCSADENFLLIIWFIHQILIINKLSIFIQLLELRSWDTLKSLNVPKQTFISLHKMSLIILKQKEMAKVIQKLDKQTKIRCRFSRACSDIWINITWSSRIGTDSSWNISNDSLVSEMYLMIFKWTIQNASIILEWTTFEWTMIEILVICCCKVT
ncbi:MAG: hypothetical protein Ta2E_08750 [Mycoplasmoidaceae bacterium]|nr:MAG: hypothetical protein Ta2E_08750 [Mycoplasmoidaceae bacterium]